MNDATNNPNNIVPLIPITQSNSPIYSNTPRQGSVRSSPSLIRGPITPTIPTMPSTNKNEIPIDIGRNSTFISSNLTSNHEAISLKMPNIANNRSNARPMTSPVNIQRSSRDTNTSITIPSNFMGAINESQKSPVNISSLPSVIKLPASPQNNRHTNTNIAPTLNNEHVSIFNINNAINTEINNAPPIIPPEPIIKRDNIIPISNRPLSPRDQTEIVLDGVSLDRSDIPPILELDTDSDNDSDNDGNINMQDLMQDLININIRPPTNIPVMAETTTIDTTEEFSRLIDDGPIISAPPISEIVIRPASPTAQVDIPIINSLLSPIPISTELTNNSIINPAPPIANIQRSSIRGRQPIPISSQPTFSTNNQTDTNIQTRSNSNQINTPQNNVQSTTRPSTNTHQITDGARQPVPISNQSNTATRQPTINTNEIRQPTPNNSEIRQPTSNVNTINRQPTLNTNTPQNNLQPSSIKQSTPNIQQSNAPIRQNTSVTQQSTGGIRQPTPITQQSTGGIRQPTPITQQSTGGIRQPTPITQSSNVGIRQPTPITQQSTGGIRQPTPITQSSNVGIRQPTPIMQQPNEGIRQPTPITQQPNEGIRQPTPITQQPNGGIRQPTPIAQQPNGGIRQPTPIAQPTPITQQPNGGIRQPTPITQPTHVTQSSNGGIRQPTPINNQQNNMTQSNPGNISATPNVNITNTGSTGAIKHEMATTPVANIKISDTMPLPVLPAPNVPNYSEMSPEIQAQHRANFATRFGILRNAWPNYHIPDPPGDMPLEQIHAQYDVYVRHIHISRDVDQYKVYLVIMWLLIELFCTKIGLNIGGYTVSQMRSMNKYERLLIELGENNYKSSGIAGENAQSAWPVEVRIFFIALVNAVTFIIIKMLANYIGDGMATTIVDGLSSYLSGAPPQPGQVLFGGPQQPNNTIVSGPQPGGNPLPQMGGPFGGLDVASLIGNLGSMFIRGQMPGASGQNNHPAPAVQTGRASAPVAQTPTTPRYAPVYDD